MESIDRAQSDVRRGDIHRHLPGRSDDVALDAGQAIGRTRTRRRHRVDPKPDGRGHRYRLTEAGADLAGIIGGLAEWGERWLEVTTEQSDPGFALWAWCQVQMDRSLLPAGRVIVALIFPDEAPTNRRYWLLIDGGEAELCYRDPGGGRIW